MVSAQDICDRCEYPVIQVDGRWVHASAADGAFCALVLAGASPVDLFDPEVRCTAGQEGKPTRETCTRHPEHHWCSYCRGWYGVPHDNGMHGRHKGHDGETFTRGCACRPCRSRQEGALIPDLIDYPCPECGYEGPHPVHYDESVRQNVAECRSCYVEFGAPPSDSDA